MPLSDSPNAMLALEGYAMSVIKKSDFFCNCLTHMEEIGLEFLMKI